MGANISTLNNICESVTGKDLELLVKEKGKEIEPRVFVYNDMFFDSTGKPLKLLSSSNKNFVKNNAESILQFILDNRRVEAVGNKAKINLDSKSTINISEKVVNERKEEIESALNPTNDKESVSRNGQESIENPEYKESSVFFSSC